MPRKGYKCITVSEKIHAEISKKAKDSHVTMREYIEHLMAKEKGTKEGKS